VSQTLLRVTTETIPTVYRNGSSACGAAARAMRENHPGFPSYVFSRGQAGRPPGRISGRSGSDQGLDREKRNGGDSQKLTSQVRRRGEIPSRFSFVNLRCLGGRLHAGRNYASPSLKPCFE